MDKRIIVLGEYGGGGGSILAEPVRMTAGTPLLRPDMRFVLLSLVDARPGSLNQIKHQRAPNATCQNYIFLMCKSSTVNQNDSQYKNYT